MDSIAISPVARSEQKEIIAKVEERLLAALAEVNVQSCNEDLCFVARRADGDLVGGVAGSTSYGWLCVKILWVHEGLRGQGLGRELMGSIEAHARALGCHAAWLDTSNAAARNFYVGLGYTEFGRLENMPDQTPSNHSRWFMQKPI